MLQQLRLYAVYLVFLFIMAHSLLSPIRQFFKDSRASGIVLLGCTALSLILSNWGYTQSAYQAFWHSPLQLSPGDVLHLPHSYLYWINDGWMAVFFLLVGMEIKRELLQGELASLKKSLLPVLAALGGMVFPALIFLAINRHSSFQHGWGIPMATDIAFSLGILSLMGKRVPMPLKVFLTALAIIDDLGAILVIALFYSGGLHTTYLLVALVAFLLLVLLNVLNVERGIWYLMLGLVLWYAILNSGIHATIAGVLLAMALPVSKIPTWEALLHDPVNFLIMPVFALANTAIALPAHPQLLFESTEALGILFALVLGKPMGIFLVSYVSCKLGWTNLPARTTYAELLGLGMIAGIGFTMSIFISTLAYSEDGLQVSAKLSVILASFIAGIVGYIYLRKVLKKRHLSLP